MSIPFLSSYIPLEKEKQQQQYFMDMGYSYISAAISFFLSLFRPWSGSVKKDEVWNSRATEIKEGGKEKYDGTREKQKRHKRARNPKYDNFETWERATDKELD